MKKFNRAIKVVLNNGVEEFELPPELKYEFKINNLEQRPGQCRLRVFNANPRSISGIYEGVEIAIYVGYEGVANNLIFRGQIKNYFPFRQGPDLITEIYAADWEYAFNVPCDITFAESETLFNIVKHVAEAMKRKITINGIDQQINVTVNSGPKGDIQLGDTWSNWKPKGAQIPTGTCYSYMNYLSTNRFTWWVMNGTFHATELITKKTVDMQSTEISNATGMLSTPMITTKGVTVITLLEPELSINSIFHPVISRATIDVANRFYAPLQGFKDETTFYQRVHEVIHTGDSRGNDWKSKLIGMHLSGVEAGK